MAGEFDAAMAALEAQVARNTTVDGSAVELIKAIAAKIVEFKNAPAKLQAFADTLLASTDALSAAVIENTEPPTPTP